MKKREPVFLFGGILVGLLAILPFISIGMACVNAFQCKLLIVSFILLSVGVFTFIQYIASRKKFQTLKNFYLLSAIVSLGLLILLIRVILIAGQNLIVRLIPYFESNSGSIFASVLLYTILALCVSFFVGTFSMITKHKSKYISHISDEVKKIAVNGEDTHIEEKGNDELTVLSRSINQMNIDLQENRRKQRIAEEQKNELISNVSHDLRSPLTSIIGYVQLLKEYSNKNDDKFTEYIEVTDRRLNDLDKLINELFELTKMDSPDFQLHLEQGDITAFVKQFGYEMTALMKQNDLNLVCCIDKTEFITSVDFERLARVMQNAFSNVMKYALPNTDVILESNVNGDKIYICLSNTIADDQTINTATMFDRFYRDDQARSDSSSAGLGLAIAKKIIELHGGNISADIDGSVIMIKICLYRESA